MHTRYSSVANERFKVQDSRFRVNTYFNAERPLLNLRRNVPLPLPGTLRSSRNRRPIIIYIVFLLAFFCLLTSGVTIVEASATVTLAWDQNQEPDVIGYKVHYGTFSRNYQYTVDVNNNTSCTIGGLEEGKTYYIAVTAYNSLFESDYSMELAVAIGGVGNGDELAIDFGASGLWDVDTAGTWRQISGGDVETMASWANGLAMDFGPLGLWNFDGTGWTKISNFNAEGLVGWANGLAMDFGATSGGLWNVDTAGTWSQITGSDVETMVGWANGLAMDFGATSGGLWNVDTAGTWSQISGGNVETMAGWANGLAMDFGALGLWNVDTAGTWTPISSDVETMVGWANGLAMDFGALGLWNVDTSGTWSWISSADCQTMAGWANGLAMDFGALGLWNVDTAGTWTSISSGYSEALTDVDLY